MLVQACSLGFQTPPLWLPMQVNTKLGSEIGNNAVEYVDIKGLPYKGSTQNVVCGHVTSNMQLLNVCCQDFPV